MTVYLVPMSVALEPVEGHVLVGRWWVYDERTDSIVFGSNERQTGYAYGYIEERDAEEMPKADGFVSFSVKYVPLVFMESVTQHLKEATGKHFGWNYPMKAFPS